MTDHSPDYILYPTNKASSLAITQLRLEYTENLTRLQAQPSLVQRFLENQAAALADNILQGSLQARFSLPDRVVLSDEGRLDQPATVPAEMRDQMVGRLMERLMRADLRTALRQRLLELEQHPNPAVALSAKLLRFAIAMHMVHNLLPSGRTVRYAAAEGEEIPSQPVEDELEPASAITAQTDAIVEDEGQENGRGELQVPYVPAARQFYLPQWVAFDQEGRLLVNTSSEAEAQIASMQRYLSILHTAVGLDPCMVADDVYQQKRYGMLGQLVNQGRLLARYQVGEIIRTIQRRAATQDLNRGLSLSLPFLNDQSLVLETYDFEIIPAGRIMFVKSFVVRAAREQEVKIAQDTRLSPSTRKHLLDEMRALEQTFL